MATAVSDRLGYLNEAASARPVHSAPMQAAAPQAGGRQLNANQPFDTGGIAGQAISRLSHFTHALASSGPGQTLPAAAAEGGADEAGAAEGIGAIAEEAAPLLLAA
jgi:hypothetical protein